MQAKAEASGCACPNSGAAGNRVPLGKREPLMGRHESSVNYRNLVRDLAEMYPFDVSEVVLVEVVANALDAGATRIAIDLRDGERTLVVCDNGAGMTASQFDEYHDFAVGLKTRGMGIGFAGIGAKISFNIADRVVTETRSDSFTGGSDWYLEPKSKLVWEDLKPTHLTARGTRVEVRFSRTARLSYSGTQDIVGVVRRHYLPLTEIGFLDLYEDLGHYSKGLRFVVNGQAVRPGSIVEELCLSHVKEFFPTSAGKRVGYGLLGLADIEYPVGPDICGVLLCTRGKVIKGDLFNQFPGPLGPRLFGLVEIPGLVEFLTTAKTDFVRKGKHRQFERLYDPVRRQFKQWLTDLGVEPTETTDTEEAAKLERELKRLVEDVPELSSFFGFRTRKDVHVPRSDGTTLGTETEGTEPTLPVGEGQGRHGLGIRDVGDQPGTAVIEDREAGREKVEPISRTARRGPKIAFAHAPERVDLAWVDGHNIVINTAHPCYTRASSSATLRRLHSLFSIATAIQRFLGTEEQSPDLGFVDRMMAAWGQR